MKREFYFFQIVFFPHLLQLKKLHCNIPQRAAKRQGNKLKYSDLWSRPTSVCCLSWSSFCSCRTCALITIFRSVLMSSTVSVHLVGEPVHTPTAKFRVHTSHISESPIQSSSSKHPYRCNFSTPNSVGLSASFHDTLCYGNKSKLRVLFSTCMN